VVSIHDVAPETFDEVRDLARELDRLAVRPRVFKVIPKNLLESRELVHFLRQEQDAGSEIVQHGYSHRRHGRLRGPWTKQLRSRLFAPDDAELLTLTGQQLETLLREGRAILSTAGLVVTGFCAPGWIEPPRLRTGLQHLGFRYDVGMTSVVDLATGHRVWTDWVGYMGAGAAQEALVGIANRINRAAMPGFSTMKVFFHPQGARTAPASRRILDWLPALVRDRSLMTYGELLGR
jgi:predicted deacetylase